MPQADKNQQLEAGRAGLRGRSRHRDRIRYWNPLSCVRRVEVRDAREQLVQEVLHVVVAQLLLGRDDLVQVRVHLLRHLLGVRAATVRGRSPG